MKERMATLLISAGVVATSLAMKQEDGTINDLVKKPSLQGPRTELAAYPQPAQYESGIILKINDPIISLVPKVAYMPESPNFAADFETMQRIKASTYMFQSPDKGLTCSAVLAIGADGNLFIPGAYHCLDDRPDQQAGLIGHPQMQLPQGGNGYLTTLLYKTVEYDFAKLRIDNFAGGMTASPAATTKEISNLPIGESLLTVNYQADTLSDVEGRYKIHEQPVVNVGVSEHRIIVAQAIDPSKNPHLTAGGSQGPLFNKEGKVLGIYTHIVPPKTTEFDFYKSKLNLKIDDPKIYFGLFARVDIAQ